MSLDAWLHLSRRLFRTNVVMRKSGRLQVSAYQQNGPGVGSILHPVYPANICSQCTAVKLAANWRDTVVGIPEDGLEDFLAHGMADMLGTSNEPTPTTDPAGFESQHSGAESDKARHLRYHRDVHRGHGH